jgi:flagellar biosynthesis anti-sigma factor FlgM
MKISYIPPSDMVESYKGKAVQATQKTERSMEPDRVELSDEAKSFASVIKNVKEQLAAESDIDKKHAEEVAKKIANGTYRVDSEKVAGKILGGHFDTTV